MSRRKSLKKVLNSSRMVEIWSQVKLQFVLPYYHLLVAGFLLFQWTRKDFVNDSDHNEFFIRESRIFVTLLRHKLWHSTSI